MESLAIMDFTRTGRVFAHIFFLYGFFGVAFALYQGFAAAEIPNGTNAISAHLIREVGQGMTTALLGLALGVLCEISSRSSHDEQA